MKLWSLRMMIAFAQFVSAIICIFTLAAIRPSFQTKFQMKLLRSYCEDLEKELPKSNM